MASLDEIKETFEFLDEWEDRYRFIIDLGRSVPVMPQLDRVETNLVRGCQSQVWLVAATDEESNELTLRIDSDAHIVRGLIAIVLAACEDKTASEIHEFDMEALFTKLDLFAHLTMNRGNGLRSLINRINLEASTLAASA